MAMSQVLGTCGPHMFSFAWKGDAAKQLGKTVPDTLIGFAGKE